MIPENERITVLPACRIRCTRPWQTFVGKDSRTFSFVFLFLRNTRSIIRRRRVRRGGKPSYPVYLRYRVWSKRSNHPKWTTGRTIRMAVPRLWPDMVEGLCRYCRRGRVPRTLAPRKPGLDSCTCVAAFSSRIRKFASTPTRPTKLSTLREPCSWSLLLSPRCKTLHRVEEADCCNPGSGTGRYPRADRRET